MVNMCSFLSYVALYEFMDADIILQSFFISFFYFYLWLLNDNLQFASEIGYAAHPQMKLCVGDSCGLLLDHFTLPLLMVDGWAWAQDQWWYHYSKGMGAQRPPYVVSHLIHCFVSLFNSG